MNSYISSAPANRTALTVRIIGIDPGSRSTGVGIVDVDERGGLSHIFHAVLEVADAVTFPLRLKRIFAELVHIADVHKPMECGIERVFMARNADSALKLGQARGAAICALVSQGIAVHEYAATEVKQAVVGRGRGDKHQVQSMIGMLLGLNNELRSDAADALALAVTHAHTRASLQRTGIARVAWRRR